MPARRSLLAFALVALPLAACHKAEIASYRAPKEKDAASAPTTAAVPPAAPSPTPAAAPGMGMAGTAVPTADGPGLTWTAPADWKAKPLSAMRKGSYAVPGDGGAEADLSITAFPGDVGGEAANVNRWRGQLQLPPLDGAELDAAIARVEHDGLKLAVVNFVSPAPANPQRLLGAMVPVNGATWFFKLMGPDAVVAKAKPAFDAFLQSIKSSAPTP